MATNSAVGMRIQRKVTKTTKVSGTGPTPILPSRNRSPLSDRFRACLTPALHRCPLFVPFVSFYRQSPPHRFDWAELFTRTSILARVRLGCLFATLLLSSFPLLVPAATFTTNLTLSETNTTYDGQDIIVSAATLTLDGPHAFNSLLLTNGAVLTHSPCTTTNTHRLDLTVTNQVVVSINSAISVSGNGYTAGRSAGNWTTNASTGCSGGSFGGFGGINSGVASPVYGSYLDPNDWGGGGAVTGGASGGGLVRLVADSLCLQGSLTANGSGAYNGGGGGGGIYVRVNTLSGSGSIQATGGDSVWTLGGGGGGRIAVYAGDVSGFTLTNISAAGGTRGPAGGTAGGAGTIYLRNANQPAGTLIVSTAGSPNAPVTPIGLSGTNAVTLDALVLQGGASAGPEHPGMNFTCAGELRVEGSSRLLGLDGAWRVAGSVTVGSSSVLEVWSSLSTPSNVMVQGGTLYGGRIEAAEFTAVSNGAVSSFAATTNRAYKLDLAVAGAVVVDSTSSVDVGGLGYLAERSTSNTTTNGSTEYSGGGWDRRRMSRRFAPSPSPRPSPIRWERETCTT